MFFVLRTLLTSSTLGRGVPFLLSSFPLRQFIIELSRSQAYAQCSMVNVQWSTCELILIKFDVEQFPLTDGDAGMTALMGLVSIVSAKIL